MQESEAIQGFCLKCRQTKLMVGILLTTMGNGTPAIRGECPDCGTKIYKLLPRRERTDNRNSARINCELALKFRRLKTAGLSDEEQEYHDGTAHNLSQHGMMLEVPFEVPEGQLLDIYAVCHQPVAASVGIAKVMWHKAVENQHRVGIHFIVRQQI
ncbi:MAG TPA: DUF5679 domain-containing protein [Planctomycetota bacterium]|nr:DUF5679 domain-containing protein [Planctomycetota bacterium]